MLEKELKSIRIINLEIDRVKEVLAGLNNSTKEQEYRELLKQREEALLQKKIEIETFITSIDDAEIRLILTLKFIDLRSWNYISRRLHYDRSTVYKKFKSFLNQHSQKTTL